MKYLLHSVSINRPLVLIVLLVFGSWVLGFADNKKVLAVYNGGSVSIDEFLNNYRNYLKITGIKDNMISRKLILDSVINEKIVLAEFKNAKMEHEAVYIEEQNLIYDQLLLNSYFEKEILPKIQFNNAQLSNYFTMENTLYHIKQIFTGSYDTAIVYYQLLNSGISIEALVNRMKIPEVKYDLGFVLINDVHPQFREIIQRLQPGEISMPLKGQYGYTVLKLEEKRVRPLLTEYEFAKQRKFLSEKLAVEYKDSLRHEYVKKLAEGLEVEWYEEKLPDLLHIMMSAREKSDLPIHHDTRGIFSDPVCSVRNNKYNYFTLLPYILKSRNEHLKSVRDIESLKDFITGIIVREQTLTAARAMKIEKDNDFRQLYAKKVSKLKIDTWIKSFTDTILFSDMDYGYYYDKNKTEFILPIRRSVFEICAPNKDAADECFQRIKKGEQFGSIASEFCQFHQNKTSDGYLGILTSGELGKFGPTIFSATLGLVVGPYQFEDAYYLFLATEEYPSRALGLQEVKPIIEKKYREDLVHSKMKRYFDKKVKEYNVKKNLPILKSIQYQDSSSKRGIVANE
ncbi:MAG: hypothetical protein COT43_01015 [Candidatus Marinimicrobia bacterium CG08_land_8_20_14_0_20_45_22]|nr:MAG: hypothetical protein COT43_01015 [Candidatus Marinimicrobia bacterium CG08_land_8_20_14_0_20_45_22]